MKSFPDDKKLGEVISPNRYYERSKGRIKTMNNRMAINTHLSTTEFGKQTGGTGRAGTEAWVQRAF